MASLIIDTSSWIHLAKPKFSGILQDLIRLIEEDKLEILSNDILIDEWDRNKARAITNIKTSIKSHAKSAKKISEFIPEDEAQRLSAILENYTKNEEELLAIATTHYNQVNQLILAATKIEISDQLKIRMADRAISKKAPFHNSKNNMADALIIFSAIDWVDENKHIQTDLLFVTANHNEFEVAGFSNEIHPEIEADRKKAFTFHQRHWKSNQSL